MIVVVIVLSMILFVIMESNVFFKDGVTEVLVNKGEVIDVIIVVDIVVLVFDLIFFILCIWCYVIFIEFNLMDIFFEVEYGFGGWGCFRGYCEGFVCWCLRSIWVSWYVRCCGEGKGYL